MLRIYPQGNYEIKWHSYVKTSTYLFSKVIYVTLKAPPLISRRAVLQKYGADVARWTLLFLLGSCGMYIAAPAYLPSSFSMYCCMIIMGAWLQKNYEV